MDVSICVVNWNAADYLRNCLRSITAAPPEVGWELIVVDNASTDGSVAMVQQEFPGVRLIVNLANLGFAAGNNCAFAEAQGRYVLLLNNDVVVLPGAVDALVAFADEHPTAGMVGCRVLNPDGSLQPSCRSFPSLRLMLLRALYLDKLFPRQRWAGAYTLSYWTYDAVRQVDEVSGCCMLVRREVLDQVGAMDERFFLYFEETDWCYRARQQGWQVYYAPSAEIVHYGGRSSDRQSAPTSEIYIESLLKYFDKHHRPEVVWLVRNLLLVETGLRLVYWQLSLPWRRQTRDHAADKIRRHRAAGRRLLLGHPW